MSKRVKSKNNSKKQPITDAEITDIIDKSISDDNSDNISDVNNDANSDANSDVNNDAMIASKKRYSLKKRYSYYKCIEKKKGSLNERQQKKLDEIVKELGDDLPKTRDSAMSDDERKKSRHEYYQKHRDEIIEYNKQWNRNNKDKVSEYNKRSYQKRKSSKIDNDQQVNEIIHDNNNNDK